MVIELIIYTTPYRILVQHGTIVLIVVALDKVLAFCDCRHLDVVVFAFVRNRFAESRLSDARSACKCIWILYKF